MAKQKGSRANYNAFFERFNHKAGYLSDLLKNRAGERIFEFVFDSTRDVDQAKAYLKSQGLKYQTSSINPKRVTVSP